MMLVDRLRRIMGNQTQKIKICTLQEVHDSRHILLINGHGLTLAKIIMVIWAMGLSYF